MLIFSGSKHYCNFCPIGLKFSRWSTARARGNKEDVNTDLENAEILILASSRLAVKPEFAVKKASRKIGRRSPDDLFLPIESDMFSTGF